MGALDDDNYLNTIDYVIYYSTGNATDFGDLTTNSVIKILMVVQIKQEQ